MNFGCSKHWDSKKLNVDKHLERDYRVQREHDGLVDLVLRMSDAREL
jgi:hypothetical protein